MHSEVLIVARAGRLPRIECRGGLAARVTLADTVHLLSAAATPLGGDTISIRVVVEPGAVLRVRSAAATMVLPGAADATSHAALQLEVAGQLDVDLQPTVVGGGAVHVSAVRIGIDEAGVLRLRERVQVGRSYERHGFWSGSVHADVKDQPLLRHRVELGAGAVADDVLSAPRALISELCYPTASPADHSAGSAGRRTDGSVALDLAGGGVLTTWQGERL